MPTWLVTGGAGFIGGNFVLEARQRGLARIINLDALTYAGNRDTLAALTGDRDASAHARHTRLIATVACKAAVKSGDLLAPDEMRALYLALARTTLPAHDVHGRATILQLGWGEIDRRFGRA